MSELILNSDGWISGALHYPSPNYNERPGGAEISLLVVHNISLPVGVFGNGFVVDLFLNRLDVREDPSFESLQGLKVSSHLMITRDGALLQFVSVNDRAWHAGESKYQTQKNCNDFSVGIELEGTDTLAFEDAQYKKLIAVTNLLQQHFPAITHDRVVGHCDIAPKRKTDPGIAFDWQRFRGGLCADCC